LSKRSDLSKPFTRKSPTNKRYKTQPQQVQAQLRLYQIVMNLLPSLLSFATLIQAINCRLLEPSSPVEATEQHDHVKEHRLFGHLFKKLGPTSDDQCEFISASYYEQTDDDQYYSEILSKEAIDEMDKYAQKFYDTGVLDMSDSEFYVPEFISNICNSDREDEDLSSAVPYIVSLTEIGSECAKQSYHMDFDQIQYINYPQCVRSTCTVDSLTALLEKAISYGSHGKCSAEDVTVIEVTDTTAKKSILSID
jgi:hypothetical protein